LQVGPGVSRDQRQQATPNNGILDDQSLRKSITVVPIAAVALTLIVLHHPARDCGLADDARPVGAA
jgi:hypothetical protein